jgi:hypothetical protein
MWLILIGVAELFKSSWSLSSMPRSTRPAFISGAHISKKTKKHNSSGFQRRKSERKSLSQGNDVYEYQPEPLKRSRQSVSLKVDREETVGVGSEDDDEEDEDLVARVKAQIAGDGAVASDDDEEIDSDEAFEESDEERFAGFGFGKIVFLYILIIMLSLRPRDFC